jgi:transcription antitermination protein NusB
MSHASQVSASRVQPDPLRLLAFTGVYLLPQFEELGMVNAPGTGGINPLDVQATMNGYTVEQRERVYNIASRRLAFQLLYQLDASSERDISAIIDRELAQIEDLGPIAAEKVKAMLLGAYETRRDADAAFAKLAPEWPTHRLAGVDRAILRLGHYEIVNKLNPPRIVINEAVELAHAFSTDKSPAFINALLDKVAAQ